MEALKENCKMTTEVKQRKKKQNEDVSANCKQEEPKVKNEDGSGHKTSSLDFKSIMCVLSLGVCTALSWVVLQQNERFSQMEEHFRLLHGKTSSLTQMEEQVATMNKKLAASEADLQEALSADPMATELRQDVSTLHAAVVAMQADESSASGDLQAVNGRFLNVTDTWQARLAAAASELAALKAEAREAHTGATEKVNEAERRLRALADKLEELEDSTRRNARALERTEEDDAKHAQDQLDWNTEQIHKLEEHVNRLAHKETELSLELQEHIPRAQECEEHLPHVEEALRSILKLGGDLSGAEKHLEEVTLQVFGAEDSMLKTLNQVLEMRREVDALQARSSILKMKSELSVVREAVHELTMVLRGSRVTDGEEDDEEQEPDEEWVEDDGVTQ
ncbi:inhibitor of nuclear factor kappa-B kinase-interacting protein-like [Dunckerocampus dactyliophorus]|uniref:inhibitor of nuclear factor kappa-B kinase-interacting protein-like n=1 Tax=Dunckerocampus dactyliophorus TaxID=161453 RepID=UPI002405DF45|nr:inhibitor of nuclear factor kappa-B kinase-interacting protein-like [Dunckerocampus dactyliophorus]